MNKIVFDKSKDQLIVRFSGEVDSSNTRNYRHLIVSEIASDKYKIVVLDFHQASFIDSSGIGLVLGRYNQMKELNGKLFVTGLNIVAYRLFDLAGVFSLVEYIKNMDEILVKVGNKDESNEDNV